MQNIFRSAMDHGVAGVVAALAAHHDVRLGREDIDDFPLPFVTPLRADQNCVRHEINKDNKLSRRIQPDTFGTAQNDRMRRCGCKQFPDGLTIAARDMGPSRNARTKFFLL
jgi:hypothetical protein